VAPFANKTAVDLRGRSWARGLGCVDLDDDLTDLDDWASRRDRPEDDAVDASGVGLNTSFVGGTQRVDHVVPSIGEIGATVGLGSDQIVSRLHAASWNRAFWAWRDAEGLEIVGHCAKASKLGAIEEVFQIVGADELLHDSADFDVLLAVGRGRVTNDERDIAVDIGISEQRPLGRTPAKIVESVGLVQVGVRAIERLDKDGVVPADSNIDEGIDTAAIDLRERNDARNVNDIGELAPATTLEIIEIVFEAREILCELVIEE